MEFELIDPAGTEYDPAPFLSFARIKAAEMNAKDPAVGDGVHHWDGERCRPAIVNAVAMTFMEEPERAGLTVFPPDGPHAVIRCDAVAYDADRGEDTWHWPEIGQ